MRKLLRISFVALLAAGILYAVAAFVSFKIHQSEFYQLVEQLESQTIQINSPTASLISIGHPRSSLYFSNGTNSPYYGHVYWSGNRTIVLYMHEDVIFAARELRTYPDESEVWYFCDIERYSELIELTKVLHR